MEGQDTSGGDYSRYARLFVKQKCSRSSLLRLNYRALLVARWRAALAAPPETPVRGFTEFSKDLSIAELAALVSDVVGYEGDVSYDTSRPDGTAAQAPRREPAERARIPLRAGIEQTHAWFLESHPVGAG